MARRTFQEEALDGDSYSYWSDEKLNQLKSTIDNIIESRKGL